MVRARLFVSAPLSGLASARHVVYDGCIRSRAIDLRSVETIVSNNTNASITPKTNNRWFRIDLRSVEETINNAATTRAYKNVGATKDAEEDDDDELWLIDYTHLDSEKASHFCARMAELTRGTIAERRIRRQQPQRQQRPRRPLVVLGIDMDDSPNVTHCPEIPEAIAEDRRGALFANDAVARKEDEGDDKSIVSYRLAKRSLVEGREWKRKYKFPLPGRLVPNHPRYAGGDGPMLHIPFSVRTDFVESVERVIMTMSEQQTNGNDNNNSSMSLPDPTGLYRPIDVSHYYTKQARTGSRYDALRLIVNWLLKEQINGTVISRRPMKKQQKKEKNSKKYKKKRRGDDGTYPIITHTGTVGSDMQIGRLRSSDAFARHLLSTKIVVVAQRDGWEDHWRLFEALASGALVLHDNMLALPRGLKDRHNIVVYQSIHQLQRQILYYLQHAVERRAIAKRGYKLAMGYHRSWHAMETLVFGRPITDISFGKTKEEGTGGGTGSAGEISRR